MSWEMQFLGCGGSMGVPVIGCSCAICRGKDEKNLRMRSSVVFRKDGRVILVDAGPDFRSQALKYGVHDIDGVIITHPHHDHTAGVDDLRVFSIFQKRPLPSLMSHETYEDLKNRFTYLYLGPFSEPYNTQRFDVELLPDEKGTHHFLGFPIRYVSYKQVGMKVTGLIFEDIAYITDIEEYPGDLVDSLKGSRILILSALRFTYSRMHLTVDQAVAFSEEVGAEMTYLTHLSHELDYQKVNAYLPSRVRMAYDGLKIN